MIWLVPQLSSTVGGIAPDLGAALAEHLEQRGHLVGEDVEIQLVAVARGEAERVVLAVTADEQLDRRGARPRAALFVRSRHAGVLAPRTRSRRLVLSGSPAR